MLAGFETPAMRRESDRLPVLGSRAPLLVQRGHVALGPPRTRLAPGTAVKASGREQTREPPRGARRRWTVGAAPRACRGARRFDDRDRGMAESAPYPWFAATPRRALPDGRNQNPSNVVLAHD